jgi:hypothetical protein
MELLGAYPRANCCQGVKLKNKIKIKSTKKIILAILRGLGNLPII